MAVALRRSLVFRLVVAVCMTLVIAFAAFVILTTVRLEQGARTQMSAMTELATTRVAEQMRLLKALVAAEFQRKRVESESAIAALAQNSETRRVVQRGNIVAIDLLLSREAKRSGFDGIMAFDRNLNALGSQTPGLPLLLANQAIRVALEGAQAFALLADADPAKPAGLTRFRARSAEDLAPYGIAGSGLTIIVMQPIFGDFGDPIGLLLAQRLLRADDEVLQRLSQREELGIRILEGGQTVFLMGLDDASDDTAGAATAGFANGFLPQQNNRLTPTPDGQKLIMCSSFDGERRICLYEPMQLLSGLVNPLGTYVRSEQRSLMIWLFFLALLGVAFASLFSLAAVRRVLAPLKGVERAVLATARGNWMTHVTGQKRLDEVGEIARAVAVLQNAVREQRRLQADVEDIAAVRARSEVLEDVLGTARRRVRQRIFSLSDLAETLETDTGQLRAMAQLAAGEVDETRLIALRQTAATVDQDRGDTVAAVAERSDVDPIMAALDRLAETITSVDQQSGEFSATVQAILREVMALEADIKGSMGRLDGAPDAHIDHTASPALSVERRTPEVVVGS
ncbi:MAG: hypothetical protein AAFO73_04185 [Pseudomonadota bacterium]